MLDYRLFKEINDLFAAGRHDRARHLLMEVQSRGIALRDEIHMLKIRLKTFEDAMQLAQNLYEENGFYWLRTEGLSQGPFCPRCYDSEGGLIRLERSPSGLHCPYCHAAFAFLSHEGRRAVEGMGQARIIPFAN